MSVTVTEMARHIATLCEQHGILAWGCRRPTQARAIRVLNEIFIAPVKSAISYAVALHEIGQILGRNQGSSRVYTREFWPWDWAQRNALVWTPTMQRRRDEAFTWNHARGVFRAPAKKRRPRFAPRSR